MKNLFSSSIKKEWQANLLVKVFAFLKIPLLNFVRPKVTVLNDTMCEIKIPLNRRTKNHINSMYFGVLAAGADMAAGLAAMFVMLEEKKWVHLSFKNFHADFHKRAEGDVYFRCESVAAVKQLVQRAIETKERVEMEVPVKAFVKDSDDAVASFCLTLSLRKK